MSESKQTADEIFESLNGYDEIAIAQQFGSVVGDLAQHNQSMFARALVFIIKRREGASDEAAKTAVMEMPVKELTEYLTAEETSEEEVGKDEQPARSLESSLSSVS